MTPSFYSRYIPAASSGDQAETSPPAKRRRKCTDRDAEDLSDLENIDTNQTSSQNVRKSSSKIRGSSVENARFKESFSNRSNGTCSIGHEHEEPARSPREEVEDSQSPLEETDESHASSFVARKSPAGIGKKGGGAADETRRTKKKKRRKNVRSIRAADDSNSEAVDEEYLRTGGEQDTVEPKHVKVLSKYQKSVRAAADAAETDGTPQEPQLPEAALSNPHGLTPIPQPPQIPDAARSSILAALPAWLTDPVIASGAAAVPFEFLPLNHSMLTSLRAKGYTEAFTIQAAVLPLLLPGESQHRGDLCISASTGSGKTLAYALPMAETLRDKPITRLRGLVVVPTRELVNQACETLELCSSGSGLNIGTAYGSKTLREEQEALIVRQQRYDPEAYHREKNRELDEHEELLNWDSDVWEDEQDVGDGLKGYVADHVSKVDILICTPGRLIEHLQHTRGFNLDHVQWLVIDEADRLLNESFQQWVDIVVPALEHQSPPSKADIQAMQRFHLLRNRDIRKIILSATMTRDVSKLQDLRLRRPKLVVLNAEKALPQTNELAAGQVPEPEHGDMVELPRTLQEIAIQIKDEENKPLYLIELLNQFACKDSGTMDQRPRNETHLPRNDSASESSDDHDTHTSSSDASSSAYSSSTSSESEDEPSPPPKPQQPNNSPTKVHGSLIFTHSTASAHRLSRLIALLSPIHAATLATMTKSSAKSSRKTLSRFQTGAVTTIISTDRASRGLDIPGLAHVVNYDVPSSVNGYVHRVGRTARAGREGTAITLVGWKEGRWFWNEIARGERVRRGGKKVARAVVRKEDWSEEERRRYADALKLLGEEARGEGNP